MGLGILARLRDSANVDVGPGASESDIADAEEAIGMRIPPAYRQFLKEFGWARIGHWEVFGIGDHIPAYLSLQVLTQSERTEMTPSLPLTLLPFANDGGGNLLCLDVGHDHPGREGRVVLRDHETGSLEDMVESFSSWLDRVITAL